VADEAVLNEVPAHRKMSQAGCCTLRKFHNVGSMPGLNPGLSHCFLDNPELPTTRLHFILFILFLTGIYKPRLRCYDLHNLGMKFERCLDAEVVTFEILSDDYSKVPYLPVLSRAD
jgi:hypothetical protein